MDECDAKRVSHSTVRKLVAVLSAQMTGASILSTEQCCCPNAFCGCWFCYTCSRVVMDVNAFDGTIVLLHRRWRTVIDAMCEACRCFDALSESSVDYS